jgi:integrase
MAEEYKVKRLNAGLSVYTVKENLNTLNVFYNRWFIKTCKILRKNSFDGVEPSKVDNRPPRLVFPGEQEAFLKWLFERWDKWRLPILFLEVKALVGCRISELAAAKTNGLKDCRIRFESETTKGRKERSVKLPNETFTELCRIAGQKYVFEKFSADRHRIHKKRGHTQYAKMVKEFDPRQMKNWLEDETAKYFRANPNANKFKLHNFRGTAMSRARMVGVSYDDASVAFGCHPETMRKHYIALDEVNITDRVMDDCTFGNYFGTDIP